MNKKIAWACMLAGLSIAGAANAQVGVTGSLGTTGLGAHVSIPVMPQLNARFGVNALRYNYDGSTSDLDYDFKLKLRTFDALLDYYPQGTGFRITGGVVFNGNKVDAVGRPTAAGTYTLNGRTYSAASAGTLDGRIDFRNLAPYLGVGWGSALAQEKGWKFAADLGVMFQGSPRTSLTNVGCTAPAPVCTQLAADVAAENLRLNDEADDIKFYPVLRLGASYSF
ncbi:MAG TPA: hypothetical protein VGE12_04465 [Noviherbaspirillum sp.]